LLDTIQQLLDRAGVDDAFQQYHSLMARRGALQAQKTEAELEQSEVYQDLLDRIESQRTEVDDNLGNMGAEVDFVSAVREVEDGDSGFDDVELGEGRISRTPIPGTSRQAREAMTDAYDVSGALPGGDLDELPAGTNIVVVGPSMSGKQALALELLAAGYEDGDGILCISTESAEKVYTDLERHVDSLDRDRVGIVDTSGGDGTDLLDATIESISSPGDLTGISVSMAKLFRHFEDRGVSDIRYGLISISTLLQYLDSSKVFRFLHVYTKRIEETGDWGSTPSATTATTSRSSTRSPDSSTA